MDSHLKETTTTWKPLVTESNTKEQILPILEVLAKEENPGSSTGLMGGNSGISLFFEYYYQLTGLRRYRNYGIQLLSEDLQIAQNPELHYAFANGRSGILWAYNHFIQTGAIRNTSSSIASVDDSLLGLANKELEKKEYDYLHGPLGVVLYFLQLGKSQRTKDALNSILAHLEKIAIELPEGITWEDTFNPKHMEDIPSGTKLYNLGLAHGVTGIISILASLLSADFIPGANELMTGCINWLLDKRSNEDSYYLFPSILGTEGRWGRLAWCYGDLCVSIALLKAGKQANNQKWVDEAIEIALITSQKRDLTLGGLRDAGLCHGTAGVFHIFNRLYQYTNERKFRETALYWLEKTLEFYESPVGFKSFHRDPRDNSETYKDDKSFLMGTAGIGLSLISAISEIEPKWDRSLLLS